MVTFSAIRKRFNYERIIAFILPHYNNKIRRCMTRQRHTAIEFCCYSVHYMDVRDPKCCRSILNKATRCQPNIATKFFFHNKSFYTISYSNKIFLLKYQFLLTQGHIATKFFVGNFNFGYLKVIQQPNNFLKFNFLPFQGDIATEILFLIQVRSQLNCRPS